jgi:hypothetical protein
MDADRYQELASRTLIDVPDFSITDDQVMLAWNVIGLCGEAGEVAEHVKKGVFHQQGIDPDVGGDGPEHREAQGPLPRWLLGGAVGFPGGRGRVLNELQKSRTI